MSLYGSRKEERLFGREEKYETYNTNREYNHGVLFSPLSPFHWLQNAWPWMTLKSWVATLR